MGLIRVYWKTFNYFKSSNKSHISGYFLETASSISIEASRLILNSGSVFLKYLNTAADLEDHNVILGFLSTISKTSATFSCFLTSCESDKSSLLSSSPGTSSDAGISSMLSSWISSSDFSSSSLSF